MVIQTESRPVTDIRDLLLDSASLSLDQLPMLPVIFDRVGSYFAERIRNLGPSLPHFTLNSLDSERIGDTLDTYEMNAIAGVFHVPAWDNRIIVGFDRDFIYTLVELLFGADGSEPPIEDQRSLSNIEQQIARFLFEQASAALQSAFGLVTNARFRLERMETRIDLAAAGRLNNQAVVARFLMQAINRGGDMFVIIPVSALSPIRQSLSRIVSKEAAAPDPQWVQRIANEVHRTEVTIHAIVESDQYTLADLGNLEVGQILNLDATLRSRIKVASNEQPLFWSHLGENEGVYTLCIDEAIDHDQQFFNDVLAR